MNLEQVEIERLEAAVRKRSGDELVLEVPFTILLNGVEVATLLCCPADLEFLTAGYLLSEGFINDRTNLTEIAVNERGSFVRVRATGDVHLPENGSLGRLITSGCGSGKAPIMEGVGKGLPQSVSSDIAVGHESILQLMRQFLRESDLFQRTGAVHSCAICDTQTVMYRADDIGRHNALDKVIGWSFLNAVDRRQTVLLSTGRASSEMVLKAVRTGIPVLVSHSACTALAVDLANRLGCTLVGFARGKRMNIYTHGYRVV